MATCFQTLGAQGFEVAQYPRFPLCRGLATFRGAEDCGGSVREAVGRRVKTAEKKVPGPKAGYLSRMFAGMM